MTLALGRLQLLLTCSINKVRNRRRLVSSRLVSMILPTFQACAQLVRQLCALHMQQQQQDSISSSNNKNNKQLLSQHFHHALFGHNLHKLLIPASSAPPVCVCVCVCVTSVLLLLFINSPKQIQNSCRQRSILYISQLNHLRHRHRHRHHHLRCHSRRRHCCYCPGRNQCGRAP